MSKATVAVMLEPQHLAVIRQFAKDNGYPSTSSALRRIIDEWEVLKAEKLLHQRGTLVDTRGDHNYHDPSAEEREALAQY